ncbi:S1C family serine protease [Rhizobium mongolense]
MEEEQFLPVAATVDTDSYGKGGDIAVQSVFQIIDRESRSAGTGFLHKSGNIITANHVVSGALKPVVRLGDGSTHKARIIAADPGLDLAVLSPSLSFKQAMVAAPLNISNVQGLKVGTQVSTWGFPGGYPGLMPILSVGVLSGVVTHQLQVGRPITQWVVNAAFNSGNSGGPLLHIETGEVIGVVSSKLAPISPTAQQYMTALSNNPSGFSYEGFTSDGKEFRMSEGQIVAHVLQELRAQVQLVIGMAALLDDLRRFLSANQIDP